MFPNVLTLESHNLDPRVSHLPALGTRLGITNKNLPSQFNYALNGEVISHVKSTKYLDVTITDILSWNEHSKMICNKANSTLGC